MGKRILTYFNIAVGVVLALVLFGAYWYLYRPLPQTSGTIGAPVSRQVTIQRDRLGVPHITAATIEDALFAQGYATAQDRLWQMDALRRLAAGRLAEVIGVAGLASDQKARQLRLERLAEAHAASLPEQDRAALAAYARGVNYFIETHRGRYPVEFALLGYDPRPWRVADCVLVALHIFNSLTTSWEFELQKQNLLAGGDPAKVNALFPVRTGSEIQPGSNAWALSGKLTATGKPILANDPHLDYSIPGIWHMVHLKAPGLNVSGVAFPGLPCVILGHNDRIAWGATNLHFDVQDLYVEKLDPQSGRYLYKGATEQARLERDSIGVKGGQPVELAQWVTRHGPVIVADGKRFLALEWSAAQPGGVAFPFLEVNRARNWDEFNAAMKRYPGPGQNYIYADVDGNIGYHVTGLLPVRRNYDGDVPVDGSSGDFEWDGYIPYDQLPNSHNPASGRIITANQNPFPPNYPYRVSGSFGPYYRSSQISAMLSRKPKWQVREMIAIQKDVYSPPHHFLAKAVFVAWDHGRKRDGSRPDPAMDLLRRWTGQMEIGQGAPFLASLFYDHLKHAIADKASPGKGLLYKYQIAPAVVEKILRERPAGWFKDYDDLLLREFADAADEARRIQGRNPDKWDYGNYSRLFLSHPVGSHIPFIGKYFNIGPLPQSGAPTSVKQVRPELGPSMRMGVDLSNLDNSYLNIMTGESGQLLSSHYKDQWNAYYYAHSFPMQFRNVEAKDTLLLEPVQ